MSSVAQKLPLTKKISKALPDCVSVEHIGTAPPDTRSTRDRSLPCQSPTDTLEVGDGPAFSSTGRDALLGAAYLATRDELLQVPLFRPVAPLGAPSEGGAGPSLLDTRSVADPDLVTLWNDEYSSRITAGLTKADLRARSQESRLATIGSAIDTKKLLDFDIREYNTEAEAILAGWFRRLATCGDEAALLACPNGHQSRTWVRCCHTPVCPWEESRQAKKWKGRGKTLMGAFPDGLTFSQVRKSLHRQGLKLPGMKNPPRALARMGWKMLTVSLRGNGNLPQNLNDTLTYRTQLARRLRNYHGAVLVIGALDVGPDGHPHLHFLVYCPFLPREQIQLWQKAHDCTVEGCKHPADDRCDACKEANIDCVHPHANGRPRCNGSWVVDVRRAYSPDEVLKYSVSPKAQPEAHLAVYLTTYRRHRVECYGLARLRVWEGKEEIPGFCSVCGQELEIVFVGSRHGDHFDWHPPPN